MIIERLTLKNFGIFRGEHSIELKPNSPTQPIILIGALNGAGKTTLIEALQLVLYGKRSTYGWRGASAYPQYLMEVRNRYASRTESTAIEVALKLNTGRHLRIRREWMYTKQAPREYISAYVNEQDAPDNDLSGAWDDEVEKLLPARLAELFFFDGEKIERLAEPTKSADVLQTAVSALLGLDLIDHLINDLELTRNRTKQIVMTNDDTEKMGRLESRYRELNIALNDHLQNTGKFVNDLDKKRQALRANEDTLHKQGGDRYKQREKLLIERTTLQARLEAGTRQLRALAASSLPLLLLTKQLSAIAAVHETTDEAIEPSAAEAVVRVLGNLHNWVRAEDFPKKISSNIVNQIGHEIKKIKLRQEEWTKKQLSIDPSKLNALLINDLPALRDSAVSEQNEITRSNERIHALDEAIKQIPEFDQIAGLLQQQGAIRAEIDALENEIAGRRKNEAALERQKQALSSEREALISRVIETGDAARVVDYCVRSIETLRVFRERLIDMRRHQLEKLILESFNRLIRKNDLIKTVAIDPKTMTLRLTDQSGDPMTPQQLSAGERQLIATATLWALAKATGRAVPIVIDTPLGRLDGSHRGALVERYFPDAGQQVILLSTDQEVNANYSTVLNDFVTRRYLLQYDGESRSSRISEGYFAGAA